MIYTEKLEVKEIISDHWLSKLIGKPAYFLQTISNSLDQRYFHEFYLKLGFRFNSASYMLHMHK